ncbi:hypothetical protein L6164_004796 [Bauhinia variegata]|uniref:Uncharacterized protein n=1 Tax=Bauhinia variegata TaxID=167791 RepID=A0ACB9PUS6_BAUVA|nr:hypothetical protein L6164_004796 [Bauhinia variegata]
MDTQKSEKSRRERRKESRLAKNATKHKSWLHHQKSRAMKVINGDSNLKASNKSKSSVSHNPEETKVVNLDPESDSGRHKRVEEVEQCAISKEIAAESVPVGNHDSVVSKMKKRKKSSKENVRKSKAEDVYEIDSPNISMANREDLELERKLAKSLKVKSGRLRGMDDGLNVLLEGLSSVIDFMGEGEIPGNELPAKRSKNRTSTTKPEPEAESVAGVSGLVETYEQDVASEEFPPTAPSRKKSEERKLLGQQQESNMASAEFSGMNVESAGVPAKVPAKEANEKYIAPHLRSRARNEPEEYTQIRRRVRGLLNRLSESNVESITGEISMIFQSVPRNVASQIMSEEILASCSGGPRGNEQYAAVFAAFVAGMACMVGLDFGAKILASFAKCFEEEYQKNDSLSLRNLTLFFSYLCIFGVCSSDLIYDFLIMLSKRLREIDVSTILTVLQCCGMKIRADDPAAMKDFILSVQNRANELKAASGDGQENMNSKRMEFMLETICDIKNNKRKLKEDPAHHTRIKKWLQKLKLDAILIRGLKWSKLLDPNKKGQWWLSGDLASATDNVEEVASRIDKDVLETQQMLQLAAAQRMNTDTRRAIFCIIMSGEDYIDAIEKLLRLDLPGKQDREIMRVLVECCLQEKVFNKYYTVLASKLCEHDKNHKFTLQFCLWDHFKELESTQLMRSMHLAKFVAEMVASFTLSLAVLKTVELGDITRLTPKRIMHFRMLFEAIFEYPENLIWNVFTRVAVAPELENLRQGIEFFIREYVLKNKALNQKFKLIKRALHNVEGILM